MNKIEFVEEEEFEEKWKVVEDFSNYEISDFGNCRNKKTKRHRKPYINNGYKCITIKNDDGVKKNVSIHRLVALVFIDNDEKKETVNHKSHNTLDNRVENLEWMNMKEQNNHRRKCPKEQKELVGARPVWRIDIKTNKKVELYPSITIASKWIFDTIKKSNVENIRVSICTVCRDENGKRITAYGYKWEYDEIIVDNEEWRDIKPEIINGVKGYKISDCGRLKNHKGQISVGWNQEGGYLVVSILSKKYQLHILVAKVFIPNLEKKKTK